MDLTKAQVLTDPNAKENAIIKATFPEMKPAQTPYVIVSATPMTVDNDRPGEMENGYERPAKVGFLRCQFSDGKSRDLTGWHFTRSSSRLDLDEASTLIDLASMLPGKTFYVWGSKELVGKRPRPIWSYQPEPAPQA